jgi:hypothetical protein
MTFIQFSNTCMRMYLFPPLFIVTILFEQSRRNFLVFFYVWEKEEILIQILSVMAFNSTSNRKYCECSHSIFLWHCNFINNRYNNITSIMASSRNWDTLHDCKVNWKKIAKIRIWYFWNFCHSISHPLLEFSKCL